MANDNNQQINPSWDFNKNQDGNNSVSDDHGVTSENIKKSKPYAFNSIFPNKIDNKKDELIDPFDEAEKKAPLVHEKTESKVNETKIIPPSNLEKPIISSIPMEKESIAAELDKLKLPQKEILKNDKNKVENLAHPSELKKDDILNKVPKELPTEKEKSKVGKNIFKTIGLFVGILGLLYFSINASGYMEKIKFFISPPKISAEESTAYIKDAIKGNYVKPTSSGEIYVTFFETAITRPINYIPPANQSETPSETIKEETTTGQSNSNPAVSSELPNNTLSLPRIGKKVPIVWNSPPDEKVMLESLQKGVVHYAGTPLPGQGKGPIFISGHSSYYSWDPGKYKSVFANLDKMQNGDEIYIQYEGRLYQYKVYDKKVVLPEDISVLNPIDESVVAIMTCVPVGTNSKRLIVWAKEY